MTQEKFYNKISGQTDNGTPQSANIIIRNLSFKTTEDKMRSIFETCGNIKRCRIIMNEDGQSRGFGFIDFESVESA